MRPPNADSSPVAMLAVALDRDLAGHVAVALKRHRDELSDRGLARPAGLYDLETLALSVARSGQERSGASTVKDDPHDGQRDREWLSAAGAAQVSGFSVSTIRRHIRSGALASTLVGRARRVRRTDLDSFLERGAPTPAAGPSGDLLRRPGRLESETPTTESPNGA